MSSTMPARHLIVLKRIMLLPRRNSWRWCLLVVAPQLRGPECPVYQPRDQVFWHTALLDIELNNFLLTKIGVHESLLLRLASALHQAAVEISSSGTATAAEQHGDDELHSTGTLAGTHPSSQTPGTSSYASKASPASLA